MDKDFWHARWAANEIGFHQADINPHMRAHAALLQAGLDGVVLVPLCGKTRDMLWLAEQGLRVVGVELSPVAIRDFFTDNRLSHESRPRPPFIEHRSDRITLLEGDFFAFDATHTEPIGSVYDRAALIALPAPLRRNYAEQLTTLLRPGVTQLLVTLEYPQNEMDGPPFAVTGTEVQALYQSAWSIECLDEQDILAEMPRFQARGLSTMVERVYGLCRR